MGGNLKKMKLKYIMISLFVLIIILAIIIYKFCFYYPDIKIKVSNLYNEHSNIVCLNDDYYRLKDGNIYNLVTQESLYHTNDRFAFIKSFDSLIWMVDNSDKDNLKAIDSSGKAVKSYSIPDYTKDFFINNNVIFCMSSDGIEIYQLYNKFRWTILLYLNQKIHILSCINIAVNMGNVYILIWNQITITIHILLLIQICKI